MPIAFTINLQHGIMLCNFIENAQKIYMKNLLVILMVLLLTSCVSPGALREKGALAKFKSVKTQSAVAACIREAFEDYLSPKFVEVSQRTSGATSVSFGDPKSPIRLVIADVSTVEAGTETRLYSQAGRTDQWVKWVSECQ